MKITLEFRSCRLKKLCWNAVRTSCRYGRGTSTVLSSGGRTRPWLPLSRSLKNSCQRLKRGCTCVVGLVLEVFLNTFYNEVMLLRGGHHCSFHGRLLSLISRPKLWRIFMSFSVSSDPTKGKFISMRALLDMPLKSQEISHEPK